MEAGTLERPANGNAAQGDPDPQDIHGADPGADGFQPGELLIDGDGQLTFKIAGPKKPTAATLTLTGGKFNVLRQFDMEERLELVLRTPEGEVVFEGGAVVEDIGFKAAKDSKTGQTVSVERRHKARITN